MIDIEVPSKVEKVLCTLHENGFEAYIVGGCVRDSILGRTPGDWDITTSASPQQVKQLFPRTVDTGIRHGTVAVLDGNERFEVTTFRIDGIYEDKRHPREVTFTSNLLEDLRRRDFTINAMAYSRERGLIDRFGGMNDLQQRVIRCVGSPAERFGEDALRMLRAVRIAAQLDFTLTDDVREAICAQAGTLSQVSEERIQTELVKLLVSGHPRSFRLAYECGLTAVFMPEFDRIMVQRQNNPHHAYTTGEHTLIAMENIAPERILRLTMLFHDIGKPEVFETDAEGIDHFHGHAAVSADLARQIMKRLKFDNDTIRTVCSLVRNHSRYPQLTAEDVRKSVFEIGGPEMFEFFLQVKKADVKAQHPDVTAKKLQYVREVERIWEDVKLHGDCLSLRELAVSGDDLIADGWKPGPEIGRVLHRLLMEVLESPQLNTKEELLSRSRKFRQEQE